MKKLVKEFLKEEMTPADRGFEAARKEGSKKLSTDEVNLLHVFLDYLFDEYLHIELIDSYEEIINTFERDL